MPTVSEPPITEKLQISWQTNPNNTTTQNWILQEESSVQNDKHLEQYTQWNENRWNSYIQKEISVTRPENIYPVNLQHD